METEGETQETNVEDKKYRKRRRRYFNEIRSQMEFYFGDSNLNKDRFLKRLIDEDPYVPLETFLNFNKLKALTTKIEDIVTALSTSELVELDSSKTKVRRKTPICKNKNFDAVTLYVESLPPTADHEWVKTAFEQFGKVTYVSLPKYKKSKKIKEFGFVEFEDSKSIEKAVEFFKRFDGVLHMDPADPGGLQSIVTYQVEKNEEDKDKDEQTEKENDDNHNDGSPARKKQKLETPTEIKNDEKGKKGTESSNTITTTTTDLKEDFASSVSGSESENMSENPTVGDENTQAKKRRKRSKKSSKKRKLLGINSDPLFLQLKVLPKTNWKSLRNKYLNLQRAKAAEIKKFLREQKRLTFNSLQKTSAETPPSEEHGMSLPKKRKIEDPKLTGMSMNFYGAGVDDSIAKPAKEQKVEETVSSHPPAYNFEKSLIVEIKFNEPCCNIKEFKANMRQYTTVKYVDVNEGALSAFIRLESADAAKVFVEQVKSSEYNGEILTGDSEKSYWKKIEKDREMKLNKKVKVAQKRGREKFKKALNNHLRFKDE